MRAKIIAISIATLIPLYPNLSSGPIMATVTADSVIRPTLTINSKGGLVEDLHSTLRLLGYYSGPIKRLRSKYFYSGGIVPKSSGATGNGHYG